MIKIKVAGWSWAIQFTMVICNKNVCIRIVIVSYLLLGKVEGVSTSAMGMYIKVNMLKIGQMVLVAINGVMEINMLGSSRKV